VNLDFLVISHDLLRLHSFENRLARGDVVLHIHQLNVVAVQFTFQEFELNDVVNVVLIGVLSQERRPQCAGVVRTGDLSGEQQVIDIEFLGAQVLLAHRGADTLHIGDAELVGLGVTGFGKKFDTDKRNDHPDGAGDTTAHGATFALVVLLFRLSAFFVGDRHEKYYNI